jgi:hypothetical protein
MSPQPQRSHRPAERSFGMPISMALNNSMFTPAEIRLVLMVFANPDSPITDDEWQESSGLDPRMKAMSAKGLREKGLSVEGKGNGARYRFDTSVWEAWWKSQPRSEKARTAGRAPTVKAKPGMKVHPDCKETCQRLCEPKKAEVIQISSPPAEDVIITPLGNKIPAEHATQVGKALQQRRRAIEEANSPKALERHIIQTKLASAKTQPKPQPKPRGSSSATAKVDQLRTARDILENPDGYSKLEIEIARDIVNGSGQ